MPFFPACTRNFNLIRILKSSFRPGWLELKPDLADQVLFVMAVDLVQAA